MNYTVRKHQETEQNKTKSWADRPKQQEYSNNSSDSPACMTKG